MPTNDCEKRRLKKKKLILTDQGHDASEIGRRVIEKALDSILRTQLEVNQNQRGFVVSVPGCHINSRLINSCLKKSKREKKRCVTVFLDVSKAFDRIGHDHITKSLQASGASINLQKLITNLMTQNHVTIHNGKETSSDITIKCGEPTLFNIAINYIYEEICDSQYANSYRRISTLCPFLGFADDQAVLGKSKENAIRSTDAVRILLSELGLKANPKKSQAINIESGQLIEDTLTLSNDQFR